jgi:hypothetical protein
MFHRHQDITETHRQEILREYQKHHRLIHHRHQYIHLMYQDRLHSMFHHHRQEDQENIT